MTKIPEGEGAGLEYEGFEIFTSSKIAEFDNLDCAVIGLDRGTHEQYGDYIRLYVNYDKEGKFITRLFNEKKPNRQLRKITREFGFDDTDKLTNKSVRGWIISIKPRVSMNKKTSEYRTIEIDGQKRYFVTFDYLEKTKKSRLDDDDIKKLRAGKKKQKKVDEDEEEEDEDEDEEEEEEKEDEDEDEEEEEEEEKVECNICGKKIPRSKMKKHLRKELS